MPDTEPFKPVFIDQMPEYQQAVRQIIAMPKEGPQFQKVAEELGMAGEFFKSDVAARLLEDQARELSQTQKKLAERATEFRKHDRNLNRDAMLAGEAITLGGAAVAGIAMHKRKISSWKGIAVAVSAGVIGALVSLSGVGKIFGADAKKSDILKSSFAKLDREKQKLVERQAELSAKIVDEMATRMLEQQKMLVGEGADMKLVSTAQPATEASRSPQSMAEKYVAVPAASKAEAVAQSTVTVQQR